MGTGIDISMVLIVFTEGDNHFFLPSFLIAINGLAPAVPSLVGKKKKSVICLLAHSSIHSHIPANGTDFYMYYINYLSRNGKKIICWLNKIVSFSEILCYSCHFKKTCMALD